MTIKVLKAKKHIRVVSGAACVRKVAGGVRGNAGSIPQVCVADRKQNEFAQRVTSRIGSSSVVRIKEKEGMRFQPTVEINPQENETQKTSWLGQDQPQDQRHHGHLRDESLRHPPHHPSLRPEGSPAETPWRSTQQHFSYEVRERIRLMRAEREEAVRRELAVGTGPEAGRR
jgi:hypothetical protein